MGMPCPDRRFTRVGTVKYSLWPRMDRRPAELLEEATAAEAAGWHGLWLADHYMPDTGTTQTVSGDVYECWSLLPAVAAVTQRMRLGPLVSPTSVHHPALLAKRAATIDRLSGGRMVLGIGAGWQINEHAAYGIELEPPGARVRRFDEALQIVRSLLAEERTTFHGEVYAIEDAPCEPKPVQERLPILVGAKGPRMLRITARYADEWNTWGDEWNTWGDPALAGERRAILRDACEQAGRDPGSMWTSVNVMLAVDGEAQPGGRMIGGSVEQLVDTLGRYVEMGFDELIVPDWNLGDDAGERRDRLARIKTDILDRVG